MSDALRIVAVPTLVGGNAFFVIGEYSIATARRTAPVRIAKVDGLRITEAQVTTPEGWVRRAEAA